MKNARKSFLALLLLFTTNLYAQNWYVCVGSFRSDANADQRVEQLESYDIPACVAEFKKSETDVLYRILVDIPFDNLNDAHKKVAELEKNQGIKKLGITGLWCVQAENTRKTAKIDDISKVDDVLNEYKIVLEWNNKDIDLDSHVIFQNHHVYFSNPEEANLKIEGDEKNNFSEIITISDPDVKDFYQYYVYNYSDDYPLDNTILSDSGAKVKLYYSNEFQYEFDITPNQKGVLWHVFDIEDDMIVEVDEILSGFLRAKPDSNGAFEIIGSVYNPDEAE